MMNNIQFTGTAYAEGCTVW